MLHERIPARQHLIVYGLATLAAKAPSGSQSLQSEQTSGQPWVAA